MADRPGSPAGDLDAEMVAIPGPIGPDAEVRVTHRWREGDSNPRSPDYGGVRCSWRRTTRPMRPSRSPELRSFASTSVGEILPTVGSRRRLEWRSAWQEAPAGPDRG